jgi:uncharacterized Zn-binding protein involved in type VI secretion
VSVSVFPAAIVGDLLSFGPGSSIQSSPQATVLANGIPLVVVGAPVADHGSGAHDAATCSVGSPVMRINGLAVVRSANPATCGHTVVGTSHVRLSS